MIADIPQQIRPNSRAVWREFRKNIPAMVALVVLVLLVLVALLRDFIATDQPLYAQYRGETFFPAFQSWINSTHTDSVLNPETGRWEELQFDIVPWKELPLEEVVWAPVPWSPGHPDRYNREYAHPSQEQFYRTPEGELVEAPFRFRHHLGTNAIGQDVLAGLIHGAGVALAVGLVSAGLAAIIGLLLGSLAGYYGNRGLRTSRASFYSTLIGILLGGFFAFGVRGYTIRDALGRSIGSGLWELLLSLLLLFVVAAIFFLIGKGMAKLGILQKETAVPVDSIVSRTIELLNSLPRLLLILTVAAISERSLWLVMAIIGLTSWTGIARFARAEFLRTREQHYIEASRALGFRQQRIILRHALPNSVAPVFVAVAFGIASAILIESALSFLGIGVPDDVVTWGSMLAAGRQQISAWWLILFPGLAIFVTVTTYNLLGEALRDALDPRLRE